MLCVLARPNVSKKRTLKKHHHTYFREICVNHYKKKESARVGQAFKLYAFLSFNNNNHYYYVMNVNQRYNYIEILYFIIIFNKHPNL